MKKPLNISFLEPTIKYLQADNNYTIVYFEDGTKKIYARTLKQFEKDLEKSENFFRIHRRYVINNKFIVSSTKSKVQLKGGEDLPIARRRNNILSSH